MRTGGAFRGRSRRAKPGAALVLIAALVPAFFLVACGSSSDPPASTASAPDNIITRSEVGRHPSGSVERAFLESWSALQYQSWAEVASFYAPEFRDFVGTATIIGAKKTNASSYPLLKPDIVRLRVHPSFSTLEYSLQYIDGTRERTSTSWRDSQGSWQMVYDSRLDSELSQFAENQVEIEQNGALPIEGVEPSPDAARAGADAAQVQARFLQQKFDLKRP